MRHARTLGVLILLGGLTACQSSDEKRLSLAGMKDKIAGGWAGQMIGVSYGAPTEFRVQGRINEGELPKWTPDRVSNALKQDDLYVDMTFAKVLDEKGVDATSQDFGDMFRDSKYMLWHANMAGRRNLRHGIPAAEAGAPRHNLHANDIDFQIEADFIGVITPGLYQSAIDMGMRAGRIVNHGDGIYGGIFVSCMYGAAFFENDPRRVVERGLACIPAGSPYATLVSDVLEWSRQHPDDWKKVWQSIQDKYDGHDPCPGGALRPLNIDAKLNGAYIVLGLLYGNGDFGKTLEISTRAGQDSDCNPASAGGILGVMRGYRGIPDEWKGGIEAIADEKFQFTDFSFRTVVESSCRQATALVKKTGGREEDGVLVVKTQQPVPPALDAWDPGRPVERIPLADARWKWQGGWTFEPSKDRKAAPGTGVRRASASGAEVAIGFEGTGAAIIGPYLPDGGKFQVYLDGKPERVLDVYSDEGVRGGESVWHTFGLKDGKHDVRLVVLGQPYPGSAGSAVAVASMIVYR